MYILKELCLRWENDDTPNKSVFSQQYPDLKHPEKRISGWRKSLLAKETKKMERETTKNSKKPNVQMKMDN